MDELAAAYILTQIKPTTLASYFIVGGDLAGCVPGNDIQCAKFSRLRLSAPAVRAGGANSRNNKAQWLKPAVAG